MPVKSEKDKVEQSFISVEKTGTILEKQKKGSGNSTGDGFSC